MKKNSTRISILSIILLLIPICYLIIMGITGFATSMNSQWFNLLNSLICVFVLISIVLIIFRSKKWDKIILMFNIAFVVIGSVTYFNKINEPKYYGEPTRISEDIDIVEATVENKKVTKVFIKDGGMYAVPTDHYGTSEILVKDEYGNEHKYMAIYTPDDFFVREEE